jgi:hypothetical protein
LRVADDGIPLKPVQSQKKDAISEWKLCDGQLSKPGGVRKESTPTQCTHD